MYTKLVENKEYRESLSNVIEELDKLLSINAFVYHDKKGTPYITERLFTALRNIVEKGSKIDRIIKSQILEGFYRSEKSGAESGDLYLQYVLFNLKRILSGDKFEEKEIKQELIQKKKDVDLESLKNSLLRTSKDKRIANMCFEAIQLAGLEGSIFPEFTHRGEYSVELVSGYNFPISTYPIFSEKGKRWERTDVRVVVIDGVIDREAEAHNLFTSISMERKPVLIVARGFGEDVIATIAQNPHLDVCPVRVPYELDSVNIVADVAVVSGVDVYTPLKGDLITLIKYKDLKSVEKVICTPEKLNIINNSSKEAVANHLTKLAEKRENCLPDVTDFINKRIKTLSNHTVYLRVGSKNNQERLKELEAVDFGLRTAKSILDNGFIIPCEIMNEWEAFKEKRPTISTLSAVHHGNSLIKNLSSIESMIIEDL